VPGFESAPVVDTQKDELDWPKAKETHTKNVTKLKNFKFTFLEKHLTGLLDNG
jgi:hypothetical protein